MVNSLVKLEKLIELQLNNNVFSVLFLFSNSYNYSYSSSKSQIDKNQQIEA